MNSYTITIHSISPRGHGIGHLPDGTEVFVLGAFPEDTVAVRVYKKAEGLTYAEIEHIITPSPFRSHSPHERPFFDANAPWRYLSFDKEQDFKQALVQQIFKECTGTAIPSTIAHMIELKADRYRNKAVYSFLERKGTIHFALYPRGTATIKKQIQKENILVHEMIDRAGAVLLNFVNTKKVSINLLKYLILRYSYADNCVVVQLLVTESSRKKLPWKKSDLKLLLKQYSYIKGITVSQSPADVRSTATIKDFYTLGKSNLRETMAGHSYHYHASQFFQIYPYAFENILNDCVTCIQSIPNHQQMELLDLFAGVGVIGIHLSSYVQAVHGVEQSPLSKEYALKNSKINSVANFSYTEANVDDLLSYIHHDQILVLDPPRSGLSQKTVSAIAKVLPEYILYISCNPLTQARDFNELKKYYSISYSRTYNIFPRTFHIEHLLFLHRKE